MAGEKLLVDGPRLVLVPKSTPVDNPHAIKLENLAIEVKVTDAF